jgi:cardiolipin synthase
MSKKRFVSRLAKWASILLFVALVQFFFNPLGLGPEPASILGPSFFKTIANLENVDLLIDGKDAFAAVFQSLEAAKKSIYVQTYIWKDDETGRTIVNLLKKAADRGVEVKVNKDLLGTAFELGDMLKGRPSPVFTSTGLKNYHGITIMNKLFSHYDHSKYFIVDHETLIFGGMNIADEYHFDWHDYMVLVRGKERVAAFESRVLEGKPWPKNLPAVVTVNDKHATEIRTALKEMIDHAQKRVIVQHAYFSDDIIIEAVISAAKRGVSVDVLLPREPDTHGAANQATVNRLLASDSKGRIRIFLYPMMSHAKVLLVDETLAAVGSANLTPRSMLTSKELTVVVNGNPDSTFIKRLRAQMDADLAKSSEVKEKFQLSLLQRAQAIVGKYVW